MSRILDVRCHSIVIRKLNSAEAREKRLYILYGAQMNRRVEFNHALSAVDRDVDRNVDAYIREVTQGWLS